MDKIPVYCDFEYLQNFFSVLSEIKLNIYDDNSKSENLWNIQNIFLSKSILLIDKSDEEIKALYNNDVLIKSIIKRSNTGGSQIYSCSEQIKKIKSEEHRHCISENEPSSLYCLSIDDKTAKLISSKYGVYCFAKHVYPTINVLQKQTKIIEIGKEFNWNNILPKGQPSQYIIIQDHYLIDNTTIEINNNFKEIISILSNKSFKGEYKIIIFHFIEDLTKLEYKKIIIKKIISSLNLGEIKILFIKTRKEILHDRNILTNYFWIHSGHATDIEKNNISTKETSIHFNDLFNNPDSFLSFQKKIWNQVNTFLNSLTSI